MQTSAPGITFQELSVEGTAVPAMVFWHSRQKQVLAFALLLVLALGFVSMFFNAENAHLPIIGRAPIFTRVLAVGFALFMLGLAIRYLRILILPRTYVALLPEGILSTTTTLPLYMPWSHIEEISAYGSGAQRAMGIIVKNVDTVSSLQPFRKRMKSNRAFSGWNWAFGLQAFESRSELVETALQFFYYCPEKRSEIGTPQGLASVEEALKRYWQKPVHPPVPSDSRPNASSTYPAMIEEYRAKFKHAPLGRWNTPYEYGPFASDTWEFYLDGTGMISQYSGAGDSVTLFEWQPESERAIKFREVEWDGDADEDESGASEPEISEDEPMGWTTIVYDFKVIEHYRPIVVMFQVPERSVCKFWLTMDYLRFEGAISA